MNWRDRILEEFPPGITPLSVAADPDSLLLEESVSRTLRERNFDIVTYDDPVAFRVYYEEKYRSPRDRGEVIDTSVIVRSNLPDLNALPYDLLQAGRRLSFSLADIFPNLNYPMVAELDLAELDALFDAQRQHNPPSLGANPTADFILRYVYGIDADLIDQPHELLQALLRRHYSGQHLPPSLDKRLITRLRAHSAFSTWPLEKIVPDKSAFFLFLQERWPRFLDRTLGHPGMVLKETEDLHYKGPIDLPFEHDDVRVYIDNLFLDGILQPVPYPQTDQTPDHWISLGIHRDPQADHQRRIEGLISSIGDALPSPDAKYSEWLNLAGRWAELNLLWNDPAFQRFTSLQPAYHELQAKIDTEFLTWVQARYGGLYSLPAPPPVMVHHIPRAIARHLETTGHWKVALVVLDGLSLSQWSLVRRILSKQLPTLLFRDEQVFAWIPTLTSVSRQSIFSGKIPAAFAESLDTTARESVLWSQFWIDNGFNPAQVAYARGQDAADIDHIDTLISDPRIHVAGLVVDKVDKMIHGAQLEMPGLNVQIAQWVEQGFMAALIELLVANDFDIFLTADHGNTDAEGFGRPTKAPKANLPGARAQIFADNNLRGIAAKDFPNAIQWSPIGLPADFVPLLAPGRFAFANKKERIVTHGGLSLDELIVPFVQIEKRQT
jgi:hypothetical protein